MSSNTTLECQGAVLRMPGVSGSHNIITISGVSNVTVKGCEVDGTGMTASTSDSHTIRVISSTNVNISQNYIHDSPEDCIRVGSSTGGGTGDQIRIYGNLIKACGAIGPSGSGVGADSIQNSLMSHNTIVNPSLDGIDLEPNSASSVAANNVIDANVILGNASSTGNGISLFQATGATAPKYNSVTGNTVVGFGQAAGVVLYGALHSTVSGNPVSANLIGIQLRQGANYNVISSNPLDSNVTGESFETNSAFNNSTGNNITNAATGIQEISGASNNRSVDTFALNTTNIGTVSNSFSYVLQVAGGTEFHSQQNTVGTAFLEATGIIRALPSSSAGAFNPMVQAGDEAIIFTNGGNDTDSLFIGPQSASAKGLRYDKIANTWTFASPFQFGTGTSLSRYAKYTATLSPASVTANTCAIQAFTVTGITAGDQGINAYPKPTYQAGLSIAGWSASGANSVSVNFCNNTAGAITPTGSETYTFVVVQ